MTIQLKPVPAAAVRPLRQRVLRPSQTADELVFEGDDHPQTLHMASVDPQGTITGIATIMPNDETTWQVRGMAVDPQRRGQSLGAALLAACVDHAQKHGAQRIWCNARTSAKGFYLRQGFVTVGEVFELPQIGPHVVMERP